MGNTWQRPITHVGLTVPDLEAAVEWYGKILGYEPMMSSGELRRGEGYHGQIADDLWDDDFTKVKMAHLGTDEGGVLELFEFATPPPVPSSEYEYWRIGWSHICVVDPDVEDLAESIVANGGRQISKIWSIFEDQPFKMVYTLDPWANMIEIYTHTHTETYGAGERTTDSAQG